MIASSIRAPRAVWVLLVTATLGYGTIDLRGAQAGPPMICHPLEIAGANSLPWGSEKFEFEPGYKREQVVEDALGLLDPGMPVIVRMETLRRATLYAANLQSEPWWGSEKDRRQGYELLSRLMARALDSEARGSADALAWFDAGYLAQCFEQTGLASGFSGYDWVLKALRLRGKDPEIEFAAAIMTVEPRGNAHQDHLRRAKAGAGDRALLSSNLSLRFGGAGR